MSKLNDLLSSIISKLNNAATKTELSQLSAEIGVAPDYVVTEAEAVIERVLAAQGERTFTIAAISDMHYGNNGYTDGIIHACQALKYIDERVKLDAVAVLGDYTDGYTTTGLADALSDFKAVNAVLDKLRFAPNIRQQGNHDYYPDNIPATRRLIQYYSEDVVWGDRAAGYFHRDFEGCKVRVICLNTNEANPLDTNGKPVSNMSVSDAQCAWLIEKLDLSAKEDAEDWGILILSHQPLDYWDSASKYYLPHIVNAYQKGSSWSAGSLTCNFAGKNDAKIIANIHGHIHNFLTDYIYLANVNSSTKTKVYRMSTPNACYGRENQYNGAWKEATTYSKTTGTADDTAFVIYCIDLDVQTVNAICYGAGYDRSVFYGEQTTYTIVQHLTNITSSNNVGIVNEGDPFSTTLTFADGATLDSLTVTMGGTNVTSTVVSGNAISIPAVTGDVVITAAASVKIVNLIDTAGYTDNTRFSASSGTEKSENGHVATGYIQCGNTGDVIRTYGVDYTYGVYPAQGVYVGYDENKTKLVQGYLEDSKPAGPMNVSIDSNGNLTLNIDYNNGTSYPNVVYFRISGVGSGANLIVTRNQEIN